MGAKHEYASWRQSEGFFTALNRRGNLLTWSLLTGKLMYNEKQTGDTDKAALKNYEVYQSDANDLTYTQDFYNLPEYSISLLKSKTEMSESFAKTIDGLSSSLVQKKIKKQEAANKAGLNTVGDSTIHRDLFVSKD